MATIFVPKETLSGERRTAATPETVKRLIKDGHTVVIERGAGTLAHYADADYEAAGAKLSLDSSAVADADVVAQFSVPTASLLGRMKLGASIVSFLWAPENLDAVRALAARDLSAFAMDSLPRTTRAQKDDALTSQASLAGYKAVLLAATHLPKIFPMQMTPAGTITRRVS